MYILYDLQVPRNKKLTIVSAFGLRILWDSRDCKSRDAVSDSW